MKHLKVKITIIKNREEMNRIFEIFIKYKRLPDKFTINNYSNWEKGLPYSLFLMQWVVQEDTQKV